MKQLSVELLTMSGFAHLFPLIHDPRLAPIVPLLNRSIGLPSFPLALCPRIIFTGENGGAPNKEPSQQASPSVTTAMAAATTTTAASTTTATTYSGSPSQNLPRGETEVRRCLIRVSSVKKGEVSSSHNFDTMQ